MLRAQHPHKDSLHQSAPRGSRRPRDSGFTLISFGQGGSCLESPTCTRDGWVAGTQDSVAARIGAFAAFGEDEAGAFAHALAPFWRGAGLGDDAVGEEDAPDLQVNALDVSAAQRLAAVEQGGLDFAVSSLDLPSLVIERDEFFCWVFLGFEQRSEQPPRLAGAGDLGADGAALNFAGRDGSFLRTLLVVGIWTS